MGRKATSTGDGGMAAGSPVRKRWFREAANPEIVRVAPVISYHAWSLIIENGLMALPSISGTEEDKSLPGNELPGRAPETMRT